MARPRFSEFLANRRRQLGLTIPQAARVLRLKEQVITAFEEGDWDRIPRSGYAQGMLSSYARYLGLNPREVIDLFQEDLAAYAGEAPQDHGAGRNARTPGVPRSDRTSDRDLYGSAGPAGSILTGTLVGNSYLHHSGEPGSSPLVNGRSAGYSERYLRQNGYATPGAEGGALPAPAERDYPQGRPYTGRAPRRSSQGSSRQAGRSLPPARVAGRDRSSRARAEARRYSSSDIQTRPVSQGMYDDDLRYGMASDSYRQASSREVRESVRTSSSAPTRPNVRRRPSSDSQARLSGARSPQPRRSGVIGVVEAWFSDRNRTMATLFVALFLVLVVALVLSVKSCTAPVEEGGNRQQVQVVQAESTDGSQGSSSDQAGASSGDDASSGSSSGTSDAAAAQASKDDAANQGPVEVKVSVPDGGAVWVEVSNGGANAVAQTVTGPWEQSFTVDGELEVRTADPSQVTVTANGDPVSFTTSAAGVGTLTVKGPASDDSSTAKGADASGSGSQGGTDAKDGSATSADGTSASSADGDGASSDGTGTSSSGTSSGTSRNGSSSTDANGSSANGTSGSTTTSSNAPASSNGSSSAGTAANAQ